MTNWWSNQAQNEKPWSSRKREPLEETLFFGVKEWEQSIIRCAYVQDWHPAKSWAAHEYHSVTWHGGRGSVVNVVRLKDNLAVCGHRNAIAVGKGESLVVVKYAVQVLDPECVHRTVEDKPDVLTCVEGEEGGKLIDLHSITLLFKGSMTIPQLEWENTRKCEGLSLFYFTTPSCMALK